MPARLEQVFARRLRQVAKEKGVPLSHVADRAGVARSYFWLLLDGSSSPTLSAVQRLAEALEVDPLVLLSGAVREAATPTAARLKRPPVGRSAAEPKIRRAKRGR